MGITAITSLRKLKSTKRRKKIKRIQRRTVGTKKTEWQDSTRPRPNLWLMEFLKRGNLAATA